MMTETVKVDFAADVRVRVVGDMHIPKEMWDRIPEDDNWSEEIDDYIRRNLNPFEYEHGVDFDEHDIDVDEVMLSKDTGDA